MMPIVCFIPSTFATASRRSSACIYIYIYYFSRRWQGIIGFRVKWQFISVCSFVIIIYFFYKCTNVCIKFIYIYIYPDIYIYNIIISLIFIVYINIVIHVPPYLPLNPQDPFSKEFKNPLYTASVSMLFFITTHY